ncbi:hypothetical protein Droror1_Dr00003808 [Drosera rotundifolia]
MGNYSSCYTGRLSEPQEAKIIDSQGNLQTIKTPMTAAELMMEQPGYVVSPAGQIRRTKWVSALKAEEELAAGEAYLLVQVGRVHRKATESELALVEFVLGEKRKGSSRVSPVAEAVVAVEEEEEGLEERCGGRRWGGGRRWSPVLEPILEGC